MLDILIKNGSIVDGTGKMAYTGNIGISEGKITFNTEQASATHIIDATGKIVCPGFIDFHSHGDMVLGQDFAKLCKVSQGITTEIGGQCGSSMFPVRAEKMDLYKTLLSVGTATYPDDMQNWTTFSRYLEYANQVPLAANIKFLVGHGSLRLAVMGYECRKPTGEELNQMKMLLRECMENGALGMSSGLIYTPSAYAETEELIELAKVVAEYDGLYATHMRNESYDVINSVKEAIEIGRKSGVRVSISHHKVCGKKNWGLSEKTLSLVEQGIAEGIRITLDQYPYTASMTHLNACIPPWYFTEGIPAMAEKLKDPDIRKQLKAEIDNPLTPFDNYVQNCGGYTGIFISSCPITHEAEGMFLSDYAAQKGIDPFDALCELLIINGGVGTAIYHCMSEEDLAKIFTFPHTVVGTDGICRAMEEKAHPRSFGTFVRAICYFQKEKNLGSLEEVIRKMTSLPASRAMISNKGILAEGYDADINIFDLEQLEDSPNYVQSNQVCKGMETVIVNGVIVYENGSLTGKHGGKIILHNCKTKE